MRTFLAKLQVDAYEDHILGRKGKMTTKQEFPVPHRIDHREGIESGQQVIALWFEGLNSKTRV